MSDKVVVLTVRSQNKAGEKIFRLHKARAVLGSSTSSDLLLDDASVSPVHAILEVSGVDGKPVIYDLASETGLQVNGAASLQATLSPSDTIQIGPFLIAVRVQEMSDVPRGPERVRESFGQTLFVEEKEDLAPLLLEEEGQIIDIFDHSPESKQSLQVTMFYCASILDVEHFVNRKRIVIGPGTKEDFSIPPFFGDGKKGRFDLVTNEGNRYMLHLDERMEGVINQGGKMISLKEAMNVPMVTQSGARVVPLGDRDFAKVTLGDVSFFLNYTPAPPRLKHKLIFEKDALFRRVWATSFILTALLLFGISSITVNPTIEIEQLPERVATILYEPKKLPIEKPPEPPKPKPTPEPVKEVVKKPEPTPAPKKIVVTPKPVTEPPKKNPVIGEKPKETPKKVAPKPVAKSVPNKPAVTAQKAGGSEGAGVKAAGAEGQRGKKDAPKTAPSQVKAVRPNESNQKTSGAALSPGKSETNDMGVVDMFKANKGTLSKVLAGGKGGAAAGNKLEGYSGFTTFGKGGLGAAGTEKGGGGTSQGLGGLSDHGVGGGSKGKGLGQLGSGGNILGGAGKLPIEGGGSPEPIVMGSIDTDAIARAIAAHKDEIKYCYEKEINAERPDLAGRVGIRFVIGASGTVTTVGVASTTLRNANTESCVCEVIKRIQFPPVRGGGVAEVTYPFVFKPSDK